MKVAIVHDWLTGMRGGEKVLEAICDLYPHAPIYTLLHLNGTVSRKIESHPIETSFLQYAPAASKYYRHYLPFFPAAVEAFSLEEFDLIISSSHCVAKGAIPRRSALHICYCHTPMRYIWSHYQDYFGDHSYLKRGAVDVAIKRLRSWDVGTVNRVHEFVANSKNVAGRIRQYYGREATVIYPPVETAFFQSSEKQRGNFFVMVTALVPYKRIEIAIEAFNQLGYPLKIAGSGPESKKLKKIARSNIEFLGHVEAQTIRELYQTAAGYIQSGEEDFGISTAEAIACECPAIAFGRGGALEIVVEGQTGLFYNELSAGSLAEKVDNLGSMRFNKALARETALRFSPERFKVEFQSLIEKKLRSNHDRQEK